MPKRSRELTPVAQAATSELRIERRRLLRGSAAAAAGFLLSGLVRADTPVEGDFFERWQRLARRLLNDDEIGEEEYIRELCREISTLTLKSMPRRSEVGYERDGLQTGMAWRGDEVFLLEVTIAPGAVVRPHNHPSHNSISVGLSGDCVYEHYEVHGSAPAAEAGTASFTVRQTRSGVLDAGRISELTQKRDNIHTFTAGDRGMTILDFLTTVGNPSSKFSALEIDPKPMDRRLRLHEARWVGNPFQ